MNEAAVLDKVRGVIVQALNVEAIEVTPNSTLQGDLGAESIDFLDLVFRLEREFNTTINSDMLFPTDIFNKEQDCVVNGMVTSKGLTLLREFAPHANWEEFAKNPKADKISEVFTVQYLVNFIMHTMRTKVKS